MNAQQAVVCREAGPRAQQALPDGTGEVGGGDHSTLTSYTIASSHVSRAKRHHRVADFCSQQSFPKYTPLISLFTHSLPPSLPSLLLCCRLELRQCKTPSWKVPTVTVTQDHSKFVAPVGIIFFKSIKGIYIYPLPHLSCHSLWLYLYRSLAASYWQ